jgi:hypothetical protein
MSGTGLISDAVVDAHFCLALVTSPPAMAGTLGLRGVLWQDAFATVLASVLSNVVACFDCVEKLMLRVFTRLPKDARGLGAANKVLAARPCKTLSALAHGRRSNGTAPCLVDLALATLRAVHVALHLAAAGTLPTVTAHANVAAHFCLSRLKNLRNVCIEVVPVDFFHTHWARLSVWVASGIILAGRERPAGASETTWHAPAVPTALRAAVALWAVD